MKKYITFLIFISLATLNLQCSSKNKPAKTESQTEIQSETHSIQKIEESSNISTDDHEDELINSSKKSNVNKKIVPSKKTKKSKGSKKVSKKNKKQKENPKAI